MAQIEYQITTRFDDLARQAQQIPMKGSKMNYYADPQSFYAWASSALCLIQGVFGKESPHTMFTLRPKSAGYKATVSQTDNYRLAEASS